MQTYQTRHLEALTDVPMGNAYHAKGARFHATQVDADYLVRHGKAKNVDDESTPTPVAPAFSKPPQQLPPDTSVRRSPGRPSNAELAARREAAAEHKPSPPAADPLVMTTRDVPMPDHS